MKKYWERLKEVLLWLFTSGFLWTTLLLVVITQLFNFEVGLIFLVCLLVASTKDYVIRIYQKVEDLEKKVDELSVKKPK